MSVENKSISSNSYREDKAGPQGTLVFDSKKVDQMIAEEIQRQEDDGTKTPALVATTKPHVGEQFVLQKGKNIIGRGKGNSVTIYDPAASSTHAQITYQSGEWKILNLLSSNGTLVNGEKITDRVLSFGDRIQVGHTEFLFTLIDEDKISSTQTAKNQGVNWFAFSAAAVAIILILAALFLLM